MSRVFILAAVFLLALQVGAQQPQGSPGATIEGIVIDKASDRPVQGVRLTVEPQGFGLPQISAVTDAEGHFLLKELPPGSHRINARKEGYAPAKPEGRKTPASGIVFTLGRDEQLKDVVIPLIRHAVITGRVFDSNGSPVMSASVTALLPSYDEFGEKSLTSGGGARTDDRGEFRLFGLDPGEYYVRVTGSSSAFPPVVTYVLYYPSGSDSSRAEPVSLRSGQEVSLSTIYAPVQDTAPVRVNIVSDVATSSNQIRTVQWKPKGIAIDTTTMTSGGPAVIEHRGLPLGPTEVGVALQTVEGMVYGATSFDVVQSPEQLTVNLPLRKGVRFTAQVLLEKPDGALEPLRDVGISLRSTSLGFVFLDAKTSGDGNVVFASTPPMNYRLTLSGLPEDTYLARIAQDDKDISASAVLVNGDTRIDVVARRGGGVIDGVVKDSRGRTIQGSLVALVPADKSSRGQFYLFRSATSDQRGRFILRGIIPGTYKLFAWNESSGPGPFRNAEFLAKYEERGMEMQIAEGQTATADLGLADEDR